MFIPIFLLLARQYILPYIDYKFTSYDPRSAICLIYKTKSIRFHLPDTVIYALQQVHGSGHFLKLVSGMGKFCVSMVS